MIEDNNDIGGETDVDKSDINLKEDADVQSGPENLDVNEALNGTNDTIYFEITKEPHIIDSEITKESHTINNDEIKINNEITIKQNINIKDRLKNQHNKIYHTT